MMRYVGVCYDDHTWDGDLVGLLVSEYPEGWKVVASHISSNEDWSSRDIRSHYDKREDPQDTDTFNWAGRLLPHEIEARFGWGGEGRHL